MQLLLIDNFDSFTYNLVHLIGEKVRQVDVVRNNAITVDEIRDRGYDCVILSPGPCTPNEAGVCLEVVEQLSGSIPLFGVCLGHQTIGQAFGGIVSRAPECMHGKVSKIQHVGVDLFKGLQNPIAVTRYHSLIVETASLPNTLDVLAQSEDGLIMAMRHKTHPTFGVQFHPESIATEHGKIMMDNFLDMASAYKNGGQ